MTNISYFLLDIIGNTIAVKLLEFNFSLPVVLKKHLTQPISIEAKYQSAKIYILWRARPIPFQCLCRSLLTWNNIGYSSMIWSVWWRQGWTSGSFLWNSPQYFVGGVRKLLKEMSLLWATIQWKQNTSPCTRVRVWPSASWDIDLNDL